MTIWSTDCDDFSEPDSTRFRSSLVIKATNCQIIQMVSRRWSIYKPCVVEYHRPGCSWLPNCLNLDGLTPSKFWHHHWLCWDNLSSCWGLTPPPHPYVLLRSKPSEGLMVSNSYSVCQGSNPFQDRLLKFKLTGVFSVSGSVFCRAS